MNLPDFLHAHLSPDTRYFNAGEFILESGERLEEVTVAYRSWGNVANAEHRAILVCHALTGSADVESWWPGLIGPAAAFDPAGDYIVCSNILGGCCGTTGPVSLRGGDQRYRADFPRISVRDMVHLQRRLLDYLGVQQLELVTGPSLGGMQALEWAALYPDRVKSIVPIGVGGRHSAWCIGMSEAQRAAIYADADWNGGYYCDERPPRRGLAAARMMAVCSYRSWSSFQRRFGREECTNGEYQVQSYLRHQGQKINDRFDANSYVRLTQAMNDFDLSRGRGNYIDVLESIRQRALIVSVSSDILYPAHEQALLAKHLPNARYEILESDYGHDGFLVQTGELSRLIAEFRRTADAGFETQDAAA
jgi:homoserine O-acetyltransferase